MFRRLLASLFIAILTLIGGNNQRKKLIWQPNNEGLFSQFLQVKVMFYFARVYDRDLFVSPFRTQHLNHSKSA
jgi:hypothetical protein